jgi:hypothetical protein
MKDYWQSIENSYKLLSGQVTLEGLLIIMSIQLEGDLIDQELPIFFIEPYETPDPDQLDTMIEHFEKLEEYEKCQWLLEYKMKL